MPLQPPKKIQGISAYSLTQTPPTQGPRLVHDGSGWVLTAEWSNWATEERNRLIGELLSHGNWFSRPPRRDILDPLFAPWTGKKTAQSAPEFFCNVPEAESPGSATWVLEGLTMSTTAISPVWTLQDFQKEPEQDTISLFGDGDTVDGDGEEEDMTREIRFDEIESASPAAPTQLRDRNWETRKFLAKQRVRESRLKAQIADRMAAKEESRFYALYGDLSDTESHFSEYDLTDEEGSDASESPSQP